MIRLEFNGWFQCRLPTDPDPYDEKRGVTGYAHAYAGEPDLDRIIHFQPPSFVRQEAPKVGVAVRRVFAGDVEVPAHPLIGSRVLLLDAAKFEGRNGVIADDGYEPIFPFRLRIESGTVVLDRAVVPVDPKFPYRELFAFGIETGPSVEKEIIEATGITDLTRVWKERLRILERTASNGMEPQVVGARERRATLARWLGAARSPARFFCSRMTYDYALRSAPLVTGWPDQAVPHQGVEWRVRFWMGGWDADALCGFCQGVLEIATADETVQFVGVRRDDRERFRDGEPTRS